MQESLQMMLQNIQEQIKRNYFDFMSSQTVRNFLDQKGRVFIASENRSAEVIQWLIDLGHRHFAEKYSQEINIKWPSLFAYNSVKDLHLNFFGALQCNKMKNILQFCHGIESIDNIRQIKRLCRLDESTIQNKEFYIQINLDQELQKRGVNPSQLTDLIEMFQHITSLSIRGLMAIPKKEGDTRKSFSLLRTLADKHHLKDCVMGMSADYEMAIAHGATNIRVARVIFKDLQPLPYQRSV